MHKPMLLPARFRYVTFPGETQRRRLALNLGTRAGALAPAPECPAGLSSESADFLEWLFARAGLNVRAYRAETLQRRLPACLRSLGARSPAEARRNLELVPERLPGALSTMLVGVTSFYRDPSVFGLLIDQLLPKLAECRGGLSVWSAGCSDGAELYSVAFGLAEAGLLSGSYLLGTDCRTDAIARAKAGRFDAAALKCVPGPVRERCLAPDAPGWQVVAPIRAALRWRVADLLASSEPGYWDVILCRNTTMYMRAEVTGALWPRFEAALRPGGFLVLGKAERPAGAKRLALAGPCVYRRVRG